MRVYEYDPAVYARKITFTGVFCLAVLVYAVLQLLSGGGSALIWIGVGIIAAYTVWETFISLSNPNKVVIDDESIAFYAYGRVHRYLWSEITQFRAKEFTGARKLYLRVNHAGLFRGKYWLHCYYFNDTDDLYNFIVDKEYQIHPNSLKAQARRGSQLTAENK